MSRLVISLTATDQGFPAYITALGKPTKRFFVPLDLQAATVRVRRTIEAMGPFCPCGASLDLSQLDSDDPYYLIGYCFVCYRSYCFWDFGVGEFIDFLDLQILEEQGRRFIAEMKTPQSAGTD